MYFKFGMKIHEKSNLQIGELFLKQWEFIKLAASFTSIAAVTTLVPIITVFFAAHISQAHLDGVGLATTLFNVVFISMAGGYSTVFDTYGPQVYGSPKRNEFGTVLVKCLLQGGIANLTVLGPFLNLVYIIDLLPDSAVGSDTSAEGFRGIAIQYLRFVAGVNFLDYTIAMISRYWAIQGHSKLVYFVSIIMVGSHFLASYFFVLNLKMGVIGLGLAAIIGRLFTLLISFLICIIKIRKKELIWTSLSCQVLIGWGPMITLGLSGAIECFAEQALFELSSFCSEFDGTATFSVIIIILQISNAGWALCDGFSRTGVTFIGSALGEGYEENVKTSMKMTTASILIEGFLLASACFLSRNYMIEFFNPSQNVVDLFNETFWLFCVSIVTYHFQYGLIQGVLVAFGQQSFIAWTKSIACYVFGLPVIMYTIFFMDFKVNGIIAGWILSDLIIISAALIKILMMDIQEEIEKTKLRVATDSSQSSDYRLLKSFHSSTDITEAEELLDDNYNGCMITQFAEKEGTEDSDNETTLGQDLEPKTIHSNHEIRGVLLAFIVSAMVSTTLAIISFFRDKF